MSFDISSYLEPALTVAKDAGRVTLQFQGQEIPVAYKSDDSPLTHADRASHEHIVAALAECTPGVPVLSEESSPEESADRLSWDLFWLVDPLDGTKEFIKQTGEYTVNIALIENGEPILGVVYVPVSDVTYFARRGEGAWVEKDGRKKTISCRRANLDRLTVVASRDHAGPVVDAFLSELKNASVTTMGSSLKFCLVAEGEADFYPRVVPTMEWDTAAAHCILEVAGGGVTNLEGTTLKYNKKDLRNPSLMAFGDRDIDWVKVFTG